MSGDSPNAFTAENTFDFKDGRASPAPTTSKDHAGVSGVVTATVLVEPPKEKVPENKDEVPDNTDTSSPSHNPSSDAEDSHHLGDADRTREIGFDASDGSDKDKKDEQNPLNGATDGRLPNAYPRSKDYDNNDEEDDSCIVNCIYYTMECCKCSIV